MKTNSLINKTNHFLIALVTSLLCISCFEIKAQLSYKVLFLGNSYTAVNDLPQMVHDVALSAGDTLIFDSYAPGGYRLIDHAVDATTQSKIAAGGWDYIVMQAQSQEPITNQSNFNSGGSGLNYQATQYNPCSVTMLYMTWGRKNGDASNCGQFPVMCTYEGMDSTLRKQYLSLTNTLKAEVSPVSVVWNYLRQNTPAIELYQVDESHPSVAGTYAAACSFYASIFKKDPSLITFNSTLSSSDADNIKDAAKTQVYDVLNLWDYKQLPFSDFFYYAGPGVDEIIFIPVNHGLHETYYWDFGDGDTSDQRIPTHAYTSSGTYTVTLTTTICDLQGLHTSTSDTVIQICNHTPTIYTTNGWACQHDTLWTQTADTYQWYCNGQAIPETNQYIKDHYTYGQGFYQVISTVNGCSELSQTFSPNTVSSGFYFDIWAFKDPCVGDTVPWMVLYNGGPTFPATAHIEWYRNDTLLTAFTNEDTLYITTGGTYECRVTDPTFICPLDTTSYRYTFDCSASGVTEITSGLSWDVFPNPASESITIRFNNFITTDKIQIYNAMGSLIKSTTPSSAKTEIDIADLPDGIYFIKPKNNKLPALKFIKL